MLKFHVLHQKLLDLFSKGRSQSTRISYFREEVFQTGVNNKNNNSPCHKTALWGVRGRSRVKLRCGLVKTSNDRGSSETHEAQLHFIWINLTQGSPWCSKAGIATQTQICIPVSFTDSVCFTVVSGLFQKEKPTYFMHLLCSLYVTESYILLVGLVCL